MRHDFVNRYVNFSQKMIKITGVLVTKKYITVFETHDFYRVFIRALIHIRACTISFKIKKEKNLFFFCFLNYFVNILLLPFCRVINWRNFVQRYGTVVTYCAHANRVHAFFNRLY